MSHAILRRIIRQAISESKGSLRPSRGRRLRETFLFENSQPDWVIPAKSLIDVLKDEKILRDGGNFKDFVMDIVVGSVGNALKAQGDLPDVVSARNESALRNYIRLIFEDLRSSAETQAKNMFPNMFKLVQLVDALGNTSVSDESLEKEVKKIYGPEPTDDFLEMFRTSLQRVLNELAMLDEEDVAKLADKVTTQIKTVIKTINDAIEYSTGTYL